MVNLRAARDSTSTWWLTTPESGLVVAAQASLVKQDLVESTRSAIMVPVRIQTDPYNTSVKSRNRPTPSLWVL